MLYIDFSAGNNEYKLRLNTRNIVALEKQLGCNPLSIFGDGKEPVIPSITQMVQVLHASLQQYQHGITMDKAYDIFDEYLEEHSMNDFLPIILDIYKVSGIVEKEASNEKN